MYAMILAAGRGERMRPLTDTLPKPLLTVAGKPLIVYHLEKLAALGVKHVVINRAWLGDKIVEALGNGQQWGLSISFVDEGDCALETAGGIKNALPLLNSDYFMVVNGDIWTDLDFATLPKTLPDGVLSHLVMIDNPAHNPTGDFAFDDNYLASEGDNKKTFSGIAVYHQRFFELVTAEVAPLGPVLRKAMHNQQVTGQYHKGQWTDVGTPQRLQALEETMSFMANKKQRA